jgi:excisionase family DNA binding protein
MDNNSNQSTTQSRSKLLTIEEVGATLTVPPQDVKKLCRKHGIPVVKIGHKIRMTDESLEDLIRKMTVQYVR